MLNVIAHEFECSCYICPNVTRFYVLEFDVYMCMDCIRVMSAVVSVCDDVILDYTMKGGD